MTELYEQVRSGTLTLREASRQSETPYTTLHSRYKKWLTETLAAESANTPDTTSPITRTANTTSLWDTSIHTSKLCVESPTMPLKPPIVSLQDEWTLPGQMPVKMPSIIQSKQAPAQGGKWQHFIAATDIHGDHQDSETCAVLWKFMEHWKPHYKFCLGDVFDFRPLRNGASSEEKDQSMSADYAAGMDWLGKFYAGGGEKFLNLGNHDARIYEWAENRKGVERDFSVGRVMVVEDTLQKMGVNWVPYHKRDGVIKVGHLRLIHGFHCGVYAARQAALTYGSTLMGHTHTIDEHAIPGLERRSCRIIGAMCNLDMGYNSRMPNTLKQANGFAYGAICSTTGEYVVYQAEKFGGDWVFPTGLMVL